MTVRNRNADLLKGIAIVLMIQVHIVEVFASDSIAHSSAGKVLLFLGGPPVAPVFMILLGFFVAHSTTSARQLIIRGSKLFLLGMVLNVCMHLSLIIAVRNKTVQLDILPYLLGADILHLAGLSLIFLGLIHFLWFKYPTATLVIVLGLIFGVEGALDERQYETTCGYADSFFTAAPTGLIFRCCRGLLIR